MPVEQHAIGKSLALHLLPGALIVLLFAATAPSLMDAGLPPLFAMTAIGIPVGLGFQLWHLYHEGKKLNGKLSLEGIVLYREPLPVGQYFLWGLLFVIAAFVINGVGQPLSAALLKLFSWLPEWFEMRDTSVLTAYSKSAVVLTFAIYLPLNGIAAPIIEELYFRGYLMPRLSRFGRLTPFVETALFTLYHFWQPYYWITQFVSFLPVVYAVWWKKNIKLGIIVHLALNLIGGLLIMGLVLGQM